MYAYFIDISQGSVEMHLQCNGICNNNNFMPITKNITFDYYE